MKIGALTIGEKKNNSRTRKKVKTSYVRFKSGWRVKYATRIFMHVKTVCVFKN